MSAEVADTEERVGGECTLGRRIPDCRRYRNEVGKRLMGKSAVCKTSGDVRVAVAESRSDVGLKECKGDTVMQSFFPIPSAVDCLHKAPRSKREFVAELIKAQGGGMTSGFDL